MPIPESHLTLFDAVDKVGDDTLGSDWRDPEREERLRPLTDLEIDSRAAAEAIDVSMREAAEIERAAQEDRPYRRSDDRTEADIRDEMRRSAERFRPHRERRWEANERLRKMLAAPNGVRSIAFDSRSGKSHSIPVSVWLSEYADDVFITGRVDVRDRNGDVEFARWQGEVDPAWGVLIRDDDLTRALSGDPRPSVEWTTSELMRSGGTGPRTTMQLILFEHDRRFKAGLCDADRMKEAELLREWSLKAYPKHRAPAAKTIANELSRRGRPGNATAQIK